MKMAEGMTSVGEGCGHVTRIIRHVTDALWSSAAVHVSHQNSTHGHRPRHVIDTEKLSTEMEKMNIKLIDSEDDDVLYSSTTINYKGSVINNGDDDDNQKVPDVDDLTWLSDDLVNLHIKYVHGDLERSCDDSQYYSMSEVECRSKHHGREIRQNMDDLHRNDGYEGTTEFIDSYYENPYDYDQRDYHSYSDIYYGDDLNRYDLSEIYGHDVIYQEDKDKFEFEDPRGYYCDDPNDDELLFPIVDPSVYFDYVGSSPGDDATAAVSGADNYDNGDTYSNYSNQCNQINDVIEGCGEVDQSEGQEYECNYGDNDNDYQDDLKPGLGENEEAIVARYGETSGAYYNNGGGCCGTMLKW